METLDMFFMYVRRIFKNIFSHAEQISKVRNAALGIVARRINWKQLTVMETLDMFFMYVQRIFKNIFSHAEQISKDMSAQVLIVPFFCRSRQIPVFFTCWSDVFNLFMLNEIDGLSTLKNTNLPEWFQQEP
ncbi:hypothetical protein J5N97_015126 [Dioscorea zingiberensis]|uniref:Uncharacterized protein n=1 Tax=Dioscorea zingiberensis TaxID=325984 RepID=A0A9D5HKQ1_9LILI|nr:hypothetical protein J5N97_015126 [Dioscorea zingiberensis]